MPATERPTEDEIREALEWLEDTVRLVADLPDIQSPLTALHLARRGAQRMAADEGSTHYATCWRLHHQCAVVLVEEAGALLQGVSLSGMTPIDKVRCDALLARIAPDTETEDGE